MYGDGECSCMGDECSCMIEDEFIVWQFIITTLSNMLSRKICDTLHRVACGTKN